MQKEISTFIDANRENIVRCLQTLVNIKGGAENSSAVSLVGKFLSDEFHEHNFALEKIKGEPFADHLLFKNHTENKSIVLAGHMDTVYACFDSLPTFYIQGNKCVGPGTGEMLGGLTVMLYTIKCLDNIGALSSIPLTLFFNSDEKQGSPSSRPIIEQLAKEATHALVFEYAGEKGEIVIGRRGKISFNIQIDWVEEYSKNIEIKKANAIEELAHKILEIENFNSQWEGADFAIGKVEGGTGDTTVAQYAELSFDVRYSFSKHEPEIKEKIQQIVEQNRFDSSRSSLKVTSERPIWHGYQDIGGLNKLAIKIKEAAGQLHVPFGVELRCTSSDANFFGSQGVSVVDGMGPVGFHTYTKDEYILLDSLFDRMKLCALTLYNLAHAR